MEISILDSIKKAEEAGAEKVTEAKKEAKNIVNRANEDARQAIAGAKAEAAAKNEALAREAVEAGKKEAENIGQDYENRAKEIPGRLKPFLKKAGDLVLDRILKG